MTFLEELFKNQPSPLAAYRENDLFRVAWKIPSRAAPWPECATWHCQSNCDLWIAWWLCKSCTELGRPIRIQSISTGEVFGTELAILNLFYKRINGRCGGHADPADPKS